MSEWKSTTLWKFTWRQLRLRPGRTLLTLLGIVIGVATVVSVAITVEATQQSYRGMFESLTGKASLEIVAEGSGGFDPLLTDKLVSLFELKAAVPVVQSPAALLGKSGASPAMVLGIDPKKDKAVRDYELTEGKWLNNIDGVLLANEFARTQNIPLGGTVRLLTPNGVNQLPVVGLLKPSATTDFNGGAVIFVPLSTAQRIFGLQGKINTIQLVLKDDAQTAKAKTKVTAMLPTGMRVQTPAARGQLAQEALLNTEQTLQCLSAVSLLAGAIVILNAFLMNLGERRKQLATLRSIGATAGQVTRLLLREAVLLGLTGTGIGIGLGFALAIVLTSFMEQMMGVSLPAPQLSIYPVLLAILLGPGVSLIATYVPARSAGRRAPLQDLLQKGGAAAGSLPLWPGFLGIVMLVLTFVNITFLLRGWFPDWFVPYTPLMGTVMWVAGCVLVMPLFLKPLLFCITRILGPAVGAEGRIAFRQMNRTLRRTALTTGVLLLAVVIAISFGNSIRTSLHDLYQWHENCSGGDFFVQGVMTDSTFTITPATLPEKMAEQIAKLDGIDRVDKARWIPTQVGDHGALLVAITLDPNERPPLYLPHGDAMAARDGLLRGETVLGARLAQKLGRKVGDQIILNTPKGAKKLRVAAITNSYATGGMIVCLEWTFADTLFDLPGAHILQVTAVDGKKKAAGAHLRAFCSENELLLQSYQELRGKMDDMIAGTVAFFWILMGLVFVVASLGIINTLTMNVLEQIRTFGVLRALGMKRSQVRKMVLCQALALALVSLFPGIIFGLGLAYLIILCAAPITGNQLAFQLDTVLVVSCFFAALFISLLAAIIPAHQAGRLRVVRALQYE